MKITGVKIEKLLLELTSPFRVAFGTITHSENVMIKVTTDEGVTGYGEAAPAGVRHSRNHGFRPCGAGAVPHRADRYGPAGHRSRAMP